MAFLVSAPSVRNRWTQLIIAAILFVATVLYFTPALEAVKRINAPGLQSPWQDDSTSTPLSNEEGVRPTRDYHPIDRLIDEGNRTAQVLLARETHSLHEAAQAYRERRGRQPPPLFDAWFRFAQNKSAVIVEEFFDQIYDDLAPFWGVPAKQIREQAHGFIHRISVRNGNVTQRTDIPQRAWMDLWQNMTQTIAEWLPDVDMPINVMDESRVVVPWEEIDGYMYKERSTRHIVPSDELKTSFDSLRALDRNPPAAFEPEFQGMGPYWPLAVVGCPPTSPARKAYIQTDFSTPPPISGGRPEGSYEGYVSNWTLAGSPCDDAAIQGIHGTFVEPISISTTKTFFPLFGGSKLPMNNEILLPPAMYWTDDPFYSGGAEHGQKWENKKNKLIWRGAASGGRNREENWRRFQRHRFVSMVNSTSVRLAETGEQLPQNYVLPANDSYELAAYPNARYIKSKSPLAYWVGEWSNAAFVHLLCFPEPADNPQHCPYTDHYFSVEKLMPMSEQYAYKYLPDLDGNSFSGRYRAFLFSTSLPIKATIYKEWHDSRLVPWKHFVPMDNTFSDIYGIMEYFVGNGKAGVAGHDDAARDIALGGKEWAEKVLRMEDMQIYLFRLLLEYARICDDDRERMGWREVQQESAKGLAVTVDAEQEDPGEPTQDEGDGVAYQKEGDNGVG
ncbi:glycosyltransferase family 90 protein [Baudoinia panamericana UAMH 10762]|uniref:Glycosyltransferase family 90 protein n=1 Tax=Baudoinia panamericana (strain UAMH 10762) TaxID=717646 RepID=M2N558_BAUPA|nr:glycosyltransferase family 90 protein [Baudoinia panamericana UAMH 10762]EMC94169.1 glycosyltransferase family 90 protein [Baudoinia panamericana UAMH 10762]